MVAVELQMTEGARAGIHKDEGTGARGRKGERQEDTRVECVCVVVNVIPKCSREQG